MRALVISLLQPPRPGIDVHGTYKRLVLHIRALHALGAQVEVAYFVTHEEFPDEIDLEQAGAARADIEAAAWGVPVRAHLIRRRARRQNFANYYLRGMFRAAEQPAMAPWAGPDQTAALGRLLDTEPQIVVVNNLHAMCAVMRSRRRPRRLFFDMDDVQHRVRFRWCLQPPLTPGKLLMLSHVPALLRAERKASRMAAATFVCSETDRDDITRFGARRVAVVPNAIDLPADRPEVATDAPVLLFIGGMGHTPNREAAERLVRRVFPLVRRERPDARLILAGQGSDTLEAGRTPQPGVTFMGFVADLAPVYAGAAVFVCPMLNGGGTRIKLLDAAAHGLPIVSSRMGAEGIEFVDGQSALLADSDEALAARCLRLLADPPLARRIAAQGRALIAARYDAAAVEQALQAHFRA